jgi:AIPR protein
MLITKFYDTINEELSVTLAENSNDIRTTAHKEVAQNKGYALLIWFLKFYGQTNYYYPHITDGKGDISCDIIFSGKNSLDEVVFYVVQSKYINFDSTKKKDNEFPTIKKEEFGAVLNDFSTLLSSENITGSNEKLNAKYHALKKHLAKNGKVKFIFFTLAQKNEVINDTIDAFNRLNAPHVSLEVIDLEKIRRDYIEFIYKEVKVFNRLEYAYSPENRMITLPIERVVESGRDIFEFKGRSKAYTFLLKPKTIHDLFKRYSFSLFFKNVRNPIHRSNYNAKIVDTLLNQPSSFWYFNNGITAITSILPEIGIHANKINIGGLQIINGAQTVYSIYMAYANAKPIEKKVMDIEARVALRLIGSSDKDFNLQITRYTNLQNPMEDRDFCANDDVQLKLQQQSFHTNIWYEKRRDEFQLNKAAQAKIGISIVPNTEFVTAYMCFERQEPYTVIHFRQYFFIAEKDDKQGLYERVFKWDTEFKDMYAAFLMWQLLPKTFDIPEKEDVDEWTTDISFTILALSKKVMKVYFALKYANMVEKQVNISHYLMNIGKNPKEDAIIELKKILIYAYQRLLARLVHKADYQTLKGFRKIMERGSFYEETAREVEFRPIFIEEITSIDVTIKPTMVSF